MICNVNSQIPDKQIFQLSWDYTFNFKSAEAKKQKKKKSLTGDYKTRKVTNFLKKILRIQ
jgi:hypothetical protein